MVTSFQVVMDCADPAVMMAFWGPALGYTVQDPPEGYTTWEEFLTAIGVPEDQWNSAGAVVDPEATRPRLYFQRVPEGKVVKNRVHLDLNISGGPRVPLDERKAKVDAEVARLKGLGATMFRRVEERGEYTVVMQDPEGNEFCVH